MKYIQLITTLALALLSVAFHAVIKDEQQSTLKDALAGKFYIGTALNGAQITEADTAAVCVIKENFSAIVAENCMKSGPLQPKEGVFDFTLADKFVEFGEKYNLFVTGHTLVWHAQTPRWFFVDSLGKEVTREVLIERIKKHITTVVGRYKGRVKGWDVVNEALNDDGSYRKSKFYTIIGEDFIKLAFQFTHEADPSAELYYNDYSLTTPEKRDGAVVMVKKLKEQGVKIDGIGEQCHVGLDFPDIKNLERSIESFAALGVKVMFTEMDISVLPMPDWKVGADISANFEYKKKLNPYPDELPDSVYVIFEKRYLEFFKLFLKHKKDISRVTLWGVTDAQSWKNHFPIWGRTDYPLLFDRHYNAKPVVKKIIEEAAKY